MTIEIKSRGAIRAKTLACMMVGLFAVSSASAESSLPEPTQVDQVAGAAFGFLWIAGAAFHPLDNSTTYSYSNSGCISKTAGSSLFAHKAVLPQGTVVRFLRLYFYDNSTSSITAFFTTYDGAGNFNERTSVASTNTGGYGTAISPSFSYQVNQANEGINVVVNMGTQNDNTLRFCGARIAYDAPITDRIFADDFDFEPL